MTRIPIKDLHIDATQGEIYINDYYVYLEKSTHFIENEGKYSDGLTEEQAEQLKQQLRSDYEIVNRLEKIIWMTRTCELGSEKCKYCYLSQELKKIRDGK